MAGTTLVRTTLSGVRPLGVRGEPLHATHEQIRGVVRRRLGERHARLLAEPQPDDAGRRIDWYSDMAGTVRPMASLPETERVTALADVDTLVADIAGLGAQLQQAPSADARITGQAIELACRRPSDEYVFLVGDQPVIVCWGYEPDSASTLLPPAFPAAAPAAVAEPVPAIAAAPPPPASAPVAVAAAPFPWLGWLLASALAIVLALTAAYVLRQFLPESPIIAVTHLPPPPAPAVPPAPPDPRIGLHAALGEAQAEADRLRAMLASLRDEFAAKRAACPPPKPPEPPPPPPKPPQVVEKKPDPPKPPPKPPQDPILKLPPKATNDYSFLKGCWRGDSFRYTPRHAPGHHTYCFDEHGNGQLVFVWQNGTTCRAPARARFQGDTLQIADADTNCSDGSFWSQDRLLCRPDASGVAQCSGETNLPGPGGRRNPATSFTVRLHRR
ncbi:MAG: hypothetical protein KF889_28890 [Alphaproteobacteria bacterium]|nr:hypothetical protein [Alphaproteobacteria bacterium]MCW5742975.1 hypothetical protein [Alphaproteobacteria bacterium]